MASFVSVVFAFWVLLLLDRHVIPEKEKPGCQSGPVEGLIHHGAPFDKLRASSGTEKTSAGEEQILNGKLQLVSCEKAFLDATIRFDKSPDSCKSKKKGLYKATTEKLSSADTMSTLPPEFPKQGQAREFQEALQARRRLYEEMLRRRKKAFLDGLAIGIALLAAVFTGWQAWEAHEARKEASKFSSESLQISQRAYIGVDAQSADDGHPRLFIRSFGNSPALNVFVTSNCHLPSSFGGGGSSGWDDDVGQQITKPEGEILTPGAPYSLDCYGESVKKRLTPPPQTNFQYVKGSVNYKDIFQKPHTTNFCFHRVDAPGKRLQVCETGNSAN